MHVFVSHLTKDRQTAGAVRTWLNELGIAAFLAHEDIDVSEEWRTAILAELKNSTALVALLSEGYFDSPWCSQEFGIAAFTGIQIVPISLDGTVPKGFGSHVQSRRAETPREMAPLILTGLAKQNRGFITDRLVEYVAKSRSWDQANSRFPLLQPYLSDAEPFQVLAFLKGAAANKEVAFANSAREPLKHYLPGLEHLLEPEERELLHRAIS